MSTMHKGVTTHFKAGTRQMGCTAPPAAEGMTSQYDLIKWFINTVASADKPPCIFCPTCCVPAAA